MYKEMRSDRFPTNEEAHIEVYGGAAPAMWARLKDISNTGACIECTDESYSELGEGALIRMTINLSQLKKSHSISAQVVWLSGLKMGVKFLKESQLVEAMFGSAA